MRDSQIIDTHVHILRPKTGTKRSSVEFLGWHIEPCIPFSDQAVGSERILESTEELEFATS